MEKIILIKYGELTTKKANRNLFINILYQNILDSLREYDVKIEKNRVRMYIYPRDNDFEVVVSKLKKIFGIHSIVIAYKTDNNIESIKSEVLNICKNTDFKSFKVETKRCDKSFPIASMEFNGIIGGMILKNIDGVVVDVHNPEFILKIEIRENNSFIYSKEIPGAGGYPVGVAGKGILMLSGGIDSPVAGYLAMKRGIKIECLYFESPPHTSELALSKVKKLVAKLSEYQPNIRLHVVRFTDIQEAIYKNINPNYMITIMRRMMYRICEGVAFRRKSLVIINGESVGQVASQTLASMFVINNVTNYPVIRPVACLDKLEIIDISKKIGTYEISILPYEDCCTIFLPKHPVINPSLEKCIDYEKLIDYDNLILGAIDNMQSIVVAKEKNDFDI